MKRILLLERDYHLTETLLREVGFVVNTSTSSELALPMIERGNYDALIIDPQGQNGHIPDLLREANRQGLRAIIATSIPKEQLGFRENYTYFQKPLNTKKAFFELLSRD